MLADCAAAWEILLSEGLIHNHWRRPGFTIPLLEESPAHQSYPHRPKIIGRGRARVKQVFFLLRIVLELKIRCGVIFAERQNVRRPSVLNPRKRAETLYHAIVKCGALNL